MNPDILTTGALAKLFGVAPRTAVKWLETGLLKSYRVPGSTHRRVLRSEAVAFAKRTGTPLVGDIKDAQG